MRNRICVFPDAASTLRVPNGQERWPVNFHQKPASRDHANPPTHILDAQLPLLQLKIHPVGDLPGSCIPNGNLTLAIPQGQSEMRVRVRRKKKAEAWAVHSPVAWISSLLSLCYGLPCTPVIPSHYTAGILHFLYWEEQEAFPFPFLLHCFLFPSLIHFPRACLDSVYTFPLPT